jgi:hypothetical protein
MMTAPRLDILVHRFVPHWSGALVGDVRAAE